MEDNYWRSDEDQALSAFVKTYDNHADFGLFVEFCQLKQKGLRKPALQKVEQFDQDIIVFVAAKLGNTRLIDNLQIKHII